MVLINLIYIEANIRKRIMFYKLFICSLYRSLCKRFRKMADVKKASVLLKENRRLICYVGSFILRIP